MLRCPTCGTSNEPDSRFCGGCGGRLAPSRVAPTQKIADAPLQPAQLSARQSVPPVIQPVAPSVNRPPSAQQARVSNGAGVAPIAPVAHQQRGPSGSLEDSIAPTGGRKWGLIIFVLIVDLAMAGAGGYLLSEGLK